MRRALRPCIALAGLSLALSLGAGPVRAADPATAQTAGTRYVQANSGNSLSFRFEQLGAVNTGRFKVFSTELRYDPANPTRGALQVRVTIDSLDTQDGERDRTLKSADLFDAQTYPTASFASQALARTANGGLEASGKLTLRGVSKDVKLPLTLKPIANGFELTGQTRIKRLDYGIGQGEWRATDSVSDEVTIEYKVLLVKAP